MTGKKRLAAVAAAVIAAGAAALGWQYSEDLSRARQRVTGAPALVISVRDDAAAAPPQGSRRPAALDRLERSKP